MPTNEVNIAILQTKIDTLTKLVEDHITEDRATSDILKSNYNDLVTEIKIFTNTLKTGKWFFGAILLGLGALGHKGFAAFSSLFTN